MIEIAKIWKILPHKNALKPWFSWKIWWGSKKPLKFSGFLLLKKKKFCLFGLKFEKFRNFLPLYWGEALKNLIFLRKSSSASVFLQFCHFRTPFSPTFCHGHKVKPWKIWFSKENQFPFPISTNFAIFGPQFHQLFAKILRWSLEKFDFQRKLANSTNFLAKFKALKHSISFSGFFGGKNRQFLLKKAHFRFLKKHFTKVY